MTPKERADFAHHTLDSPIFREMLAEIERGMVRRLKDADLAYPDKIARTVLALQILEQFPVVLRKFASDGELVDFNLKEAEFATKVRKQRYSTP